MLKKKWKYKVSFAVLVISIVGVSVIYFINISNGQESRIITVKEAESSGETKDNAVSEDDIKSNTEVRDSEEYLATTADSSLTAIFISNNTSLDSSSLGMLADLPTSDLPTSDLPTSDQPTSDQPTSDLPTSNQPTSDLPGTGILDTTIQATSAGNPVLDTQPQTVNLSNSSKEELMSFQGYIIDRCCLKDPGPEEDTTDCLLMDSCRDSGYGLAVKYGSGYSWYEFDPAGKEKAYEILKVTTRYTKIHVLVKGSLENSILHVSEIHEN